MARGKTKRYGINPKIYEIKKVLPVVIDSNSLKNMEEMAFEKGKLSEKKEELEFLKDIEFKDNLEKEMLIFNKISQLKKEIINDKQKD